MRRALPLSPAGLRSCGAQRGKDRGWHGPRDGARGNLSLLRLPRPQDLLLIMLTSLAPSPMASVTAFLYFFTNSTTWAFCKGVTRQQMTALQAHAVSRNSTSMSASSAWACEESGETVGGTAHSRARCPIQPGTSRSLTRLCPLMTRAYSPAMASRTEVSLEEESFSW